MSDIMTAAEVRAARKRVQAYGRPGAFDVSDLADTCEALATAAREYREANLAFDEYEGDSDSEYNILLYRYLDADEALDALLATWRGE